MDNSAKKEAEQKKSDKKDSEENSQNKTAGTELSLKNKLIELQSLLDDGLISTEEYDNLRKKILSQI